MWEKFLCLICEGLVPAHHIATYSKGKRRDVCDCHYNIILVCIVLALSSQFFPSAFVFSLIHYYMVYYGN